VPSSWKRDQGFYRAKCLTFYISIVCFREIKTVESDLFCCKIQLPPPFRFWLLSTWMLRQAYHWLDAPGYFDGCFATLGYSSHGLARITAVGPLSRVIWDPLPPALLPASHYPVPSINPPSLRLSYFTIFSLNLPFLSLLLLSSTLRNSVNENWDVAPGDFFENTHAILCIYLFFECQILLVIVMFCGQQIELFSDGKITSAKDIIGN
jgi:hypothetical protein